MAGAPSAFDAEQTRALEATVRALSAAAKTLRLYPPTSEMPRQSVEAALEPLRRILAQESTLKLTVARQGFACGSQEIGKNTPGAADLSDQLRAHGVSEVEFAPTVNTGQLLSFLTMLLKSPEEVRTAGGLDGALSAVGVTAVTVGVINLMISDAMGPAEDEDVDEFLRQLARDPDRLSAWVSRAARGDPASFAEGLVELGGAAGGAGKPLLLDTLAKAFVGLDAMGKDALLSVTVDGRDGANLVQEMLGLVPPSDVASALCEGPRGANLLSLSSTLTKLPLAERLGDVLAKVQERLASEGRTEGELKFFDRMVGLRASAEPEPALVTADPTFRQVAEAAQVAPEELAASLSAAVAPQAAVDEHTARTMLALLDSQTTFSAYCRQLNAVAGLVPRLIERSELTLADKVLGELDRRQGSTDQPWPELTDKYRAAIATATSRQAMSALLSAVLKDPAAMAPAKQVVARGGEQASKSLVESALASPDAKALDLAGELVGRRLGDLLAAASTQAPTSQIAAVVHYLLKDGHGRATDAIHALLRRPDPACRKEAVKGLAQGGIAGVRYLDTLLADDNVEIAAAASRALASIGAPTAASALVRRLDELAVDGKDFGLAKEIIAALGRMDDPGAKDALLRLAKRKALFKHGHFAEVQALARTALQKRGAAEVSR